MCQHCSPIEDPDPGGPGGLPARGRRDFLRTAAWGGAVLGTAGTGLLGWMDRAAASGNSTSTSGTGSKSGSAAAAVSSIAAPHIVTRAQWGADESIRNPTPTGWAPIRKVIVHHTAGPNVHGGSGVVRGIYELFVLHRGYSDIGYNFLIDRDGTIYEGRRARAYGSGEIHDGENGSGLGMIGGHALGYNAGAVGIALIGDYVAKEPTSAALASLTRLAAWKMQRHQIDPLGSDHYITIMGKARTFPNLCGHRDVGQTVCPGAHLAAHLDAVRHDVAALIGRFPARSSDMRKLATIYEL